MEHEPSRLRPRLHTGHGRLGEIPVRPVAHGRIHIVAELGHGHLVLAVAEGGHEPVAPEGTLGHGEQGSVVLLHPAVVGPRCIVREDEPIVAAAKGELGRQRPPVAGSVGANVALSKVIPRRHPVVRVADLGVEGAAREREPRKLVHIRLARLRPRAGQAVAAEPLPARVQGVGRRDARLAEIALVPVAAPVAIDVQPPRERISRAVEPEGAVRVTPDHRIVAHQGARREQGPLRVPGDVDGQVPRYLPIGDQGVIVEVLHAAGAGAGRIRPPRIELRIVDHQRRAGDARGAVRRAHAGHIVAAGEVGTDRVKYPPTVLDEGRAAVQSTRRAVAGGDAVGDHRRGGGRAVRGDRHRVHALGRAVVIPGEELVHRRHRLLHAPAIAPLLAHRLQGQGADGAEHYGRKRAFLVLEIELPPAAVLLVHRGHGQGEAVADEYPVEVEFSAATAPRARPVA